MIDTVTKLWHSAESAQFYGKAEHQEPSSFLILRAIKKEPSLLDDQAAFQKQYGLATDQYPIVGQAAGEGALAP